MRAVEGPTDRALATQAPTADAIVVLSAGRTVAPGRDSVSEWEDADRFFGGVELFLAGKANLLVFTGARPSGPQGAPLEGATLSAYATQMGVPIDHVATTGPVANTQDEANDVAVLLRDRRAGPTRVLLVTSAFHMPRAQYLFEKAGLTVVPFPVDFRRVAGSRPGLADLLPSAVALQKTHTMLHELYGRIFYRLVEMVSATRRPNGQHSDVSLNATG
ncbi:MAG: YdcF family protein [Vicinamibacterales bacterium]